MAQQQGNQPAAAQLDPRELETRRSMKAFFDDPDYHPHRDHAKFRMNLRAQFLFLLLDELRAERRNAAMAKRNMTVNRDAKKAHLLGLPTEIRLHIYNILFKGAKMVISPANSFPVAGSTRQRYSIQIQDNTSEQKNISTRILLVCQDIFKEALPVFLKNLAINAGLGSAHFRKVVSPMTRGSVQEIWNLRPQYALGLFPNMQLWIGDRKWFVNGGMCTELSSMDSKEMYSIAIGIFMAGDVAGTHSLLISSYQCEKVSFLGKIDMLACYQLGLNGGLFHLGSAPLGCGSEHDSIGHVYVNFNKRQAFFDQGDSLGHDASIMKLRQM